MDFGLGLVLSFTDNATSGIQNAVGSLNQLTETASNATNTLSGMAQLGAFSVVADQIGSSAIKAGQGIMGMFTGLLGHVQKTGSEFENFRLTLNALYQDEARAEQQIQKLLDFSVRSPFEVDDVKDMLVVLQSQGIDAFEKVKGSINGVHQENLAWLADLMAFKPDIPMQRWRLAITNFLGSGEVRVLRNVLDMGNIEDIVGHDIGDTVADRMNTLVEIVDSKNLSGLANNMATTWQGVASNIDDAWTKLYMSVADNGVFESLKESFVGVAGAIMSLSDPEIKALGKTLAEGLNIIVVPITIVAKKVNELIGAIVDLCQTNPGLVKFGMVLAAIAGSLLIVGGVALKFASSIALLSIGMSQFGNAFTSVSTLLKSGAMKIISTLLPLTALIGLVYLSWKNDFGGIQTLLRNFIANIRGSFDTANQLLSMNVDDMVVKIDGLSSTGNFWDNITVGLARIGFAAKALADAWPDYTLSEENYERARELGILPLIEAVLDLKWRLEHFVKGFKDGFNSVLTTVVNFVSGIASALGGTGTIFDTIIEKATEFFQLLTDNDPKAWEDLGEFIGKVAAKLVLAWAALKLFNGIVGKISMVVTAVSGLSKAVSGIFSIFTRLGSVVSSVIGFLTKHFPNLTGIVGSLRQGLQSAFGSNLGIIDNLRVLFAGAMDYLEGAAVGLAQAIGVPVQAVIGVIMLVIGSVITYAITHWEEFKTKVLTIWDTIKTEADKIWTSFKDGILAIWDNIKFYVSSVVDKFNEMKDRFNELKTAITESAAFQFIISVLSEIGKVITDTLVPAISGIVTIVSTALQGIWMTIVSIVNGIVGTISSFMTMIMGIISGIMNVIIGIFTGDFGKILSGIREVFGSILNFIGTVLLHIADIILSALSGIVGVVVDIGATIVSTVVGFVGSIGETLVGLAGKALGWGSDFIQGLVDGIKGGVKKVTDAVKGVADKIKSFLHFSVPDEGPLTDYESWMPDFMNGLANGINQSSSVVTSAITQFTAQVKQSLNSDIMTSFQMFSQQWTQQMTIIVTSTNQMSNGVRTGMTVLVTSTRQVGTGYVSTFRSITTVTKTTVSQANSNFTKMSTIFTKSLTTMVNVQKTGFNAITTNTTTTFSKVVSIVSSQMSKAVSAVQTAVNKMKAAMRFTWSLPKLKVPHVNITGKFNLDPPKAPKFKVDWYAKGGVFNTPSVIGVGEAGKEAVMPLENNTGWIRDLAFMITDVMREYKPAYVPVDSSSVSTTSNTSEDRYITSNVTNNTTRQGDTDNSVTFAEGSIQINCRDTSEAEAVKLATKIMEYIKRKKQVDKMLAYG